MSALATVAGKSFNGKFTPKILIDLKKKTKNKNKTKTKQNKTKQKRLVCLYKFGMIFLTSAFYNIFKNEIIFCVYFFDIYWFLKT